MGEMLRKCIACGQMQQKQMLVRIVKFDGEVSVDETGRKNGRGCYICKTADCYSAALKKRRIDRAFSMKVSDEIYSVLKEICNAQ